MQRLPAWSADGLPDVSSDVGPDHALVAAIRADPAAFDLLYRQYYERVLAYARARAATSEDAADLTQQIFLRAFAAFTTYHPARGSLAAWLFGIARNAAVDLRRRQRVAHDTQYLPLAGSPAPTDPQDAALRAEAVDRLRALLARLDHRKRELLVLRFAAGLSTADIAAVTGKSEAAVRKAITRILHTLKELYNDADPRP